MRAGGVDPLVEMRVGGVPHECRFFLLKYGGKIWGQNIGPKYGAKIWSQNIRPKYQAKIWGQNIGPKYQAKI